MILCFFISLIGFKQSIKNNLYQFGILKSIGINNINLIYIILIESLIIVFVGIIFGTIIGISQ